MSVIFLPPKMADILLSEFITLTEHVELCFNHYRHRRDLLTVIHALYLTCDQRFVDYVRDFCRSKNHGHFESSLFTVKKKSW